MSRHYALLVILAVFLLLTADAYPSGHSLKETSAQNVESVMHEAVNYAENGEIDSGNLNKPTQPPYKEKTTKEPGTYLQSIWDVYYPVQGKK